MKLRKELAHAKSLLKGRAGKHNPTLVNDENHINVLFTPKSKSGKGFPTPSSSRRTPGRYAAPIDPFLQSPSLTFETEEKIKMLERLLSLSIDREVQQTLRINQLSSEISSSSSLPQKKEAKITLIFSPFADERKANLTNTLKRALPRSTLRVYDGDVECVENEIGGFPLSDDRSNNNNGEEENGENLLKNRMKTAISVIMNEDNYEDVITLLASNNFFHEDLQNVIVQFERSAKVVVLIHPIYYTVRNH